MTFHITGPGEYKTRDGRKAVVLARIPLDSCGFPWLGYLGNSPMYWANNGQRSLPGIPVYQDVVSVWQEPVMVEGWANIFVAGIAVKNSKIEADEIAKITPIPNSRIACRKIRWNGSKIIDVTED